MPPRRSAQGRHKRLIVTADDVGLDRGMTTGAIEAHRSGIVTACSIVANGREFDDAISRLRDVPKLEVGVHLTLVEERALATGKAMPRNWFRVLFSGWKNVESELRAQIEKVIATGLRVTHLNGHQHLHMLPAIRRVVERLGREYGIGYIRNVNDRGGKSRRVSMTILNALGSDSPRTIGIAEAGHLTSDRLVALLDHVDGVTELVTHPGRDVRAYAHWRYDWETELHALCDPRVRERLSALEIQLTAPS